MFFKARSCYADPYGKTWPIRCNLSVSIRPKLPVGLRIGLKKPDYKMRWISPHRVSLGVKNRNWRLVGL